jgi:hypothetical protein
MNKDILSWLLEKENPSSRYLTMKHLLGYRERNSSLLEARRAIADMRQVRRIFEKQNRDGFWGKRDSPYLPKYKSTYWTLMLLAQLGIELDRRIEKACEYIFGFQKEHGGFIESWKDGISTPCLTGNVLIFLHHFGYGKDSRTRRAVEHLCETQMSEIPSKIRGKLGSFEETRSSLLKESYNGGWVCHEWKSHSHDRHGCFQGTITPLEALALSGRRKECRRGAEFLLRHRLFLADHHDFSVIKPHFLMLGFPTFFYSILRCLRVLTDIGVRDKRMEDALDVLALKRRENGRWVAESVPSPLATFDRRGHESKWVTLETMNVLRKFGNEKPHSYVDI